MESSLAGQHGRSVTTNKARHSERPQGAEEPREFVLTSIAQTLFYLEG